ncbi:MAG TPA: hypothetical protein VFA97_10685 [Gaiellaceae bacterium]|nr:hypothetical protein [Gaiellaceae bacterium]
MAENVPCDVGWAVGPDVQLVDALARLQVAARRRDCSLLLENVSSELAELVDLMGLSEVLNAER